MKLLGQANMIAAASILTLSQLAAAQATPASPKNPSAHATSLAVTRPTTAPAPSAVATTAPAKQIPAPPYTLTRYSEDYSYLKDPARRDNPFDSIKYIPLGPDDFYLSLGGQIRERYEYRNNNLFGSGPQDEDGFYLTRLTLHGDLRLGKNLRFFAQGKSSLEDGREGGPRTSDLDQLEAQQLFVDLTLPWTDNAKTTVRFGRQEFLYGVQRTITPANWANIRRAFDGLALLNQFSGENFSHNMDVFVVRPVLVRRPPLANEVEGFNNGDESQTFWGIYDTLSLPDFLPKAASTLEGYVLGLNQTATDAVAPARTVDADNYTVGSRFSTSPKPLDFDIEGAYQFGNRGSQAISAFFVATEAGFTLDGVTASPRPFAGFDYASGDGSRTDSNYSTYSQLFPGGHRYFGEVDVIGRQNIVSPNVGIDFTLLSNSGWARRLTLRTRYFALFRANDNDNVYISSGAVLSRPAASTESFIGHELDFVLTWQVNRHFLIVASYNHFFAGNYIHASNGGDNNLSRDIDFAYLQAQFTF